jgi:hypothetical protein
VDLEAEFSVALYCAELFPDLDVFEDPEVVEDWSDWQ